MHVTISERLPEIYELARTRNEQSRTKLASILADVFLSGSALNEREQILVNEIIDELIGNTTPQVKRMLAEKLALSASVPHRVLLSLACDTQADVARPILCTSTRLKDEDLIFVVEAHGKDHALAIAERKAISEAVVDALVATGEIDVMTCVAENLGAKIAPRALHVMVEAARFGKKLHEPLLKRPELTTDMGLNMFWWTSHELRRKVIARFGISGGQIEHALETAINDLLGSVENERDNEAAMQRVAEWFSERESLNPRVMIQALRMGFFKLFDVMIAMKTGLDVALVDMMITDEGNHSISVLAKSLGIDKPSFVSIFLLSRGARPGEQIVNPRELSGAIAAFDKVDVATAKSLVESWKRDPSYLLSRLKKPVH